MMMTVGCLYFLLLSDTAFSGICAASGRDARIKKLGYYLRSMWDGALWGHAFVVLGVIILSVAVRSATDPQRALDDLVVMGQRFISVCGVYAAVVFATFAVRAIPSVDLRSATSTMAFGPLTLMRPADHRRWRWCCHSDCAWPAYVSDCGLTDWGDDDSVSKILELEV